MWNISKRKLDSGEIPVTNGNCRVLEWNEGTNQVACTIRYVRGCNRDERMAQSLLENSTKSRVSVSFPEELQILRGFH